MWFLLTQTLVTQYCMVYSEIGSASRACFCQPNIFRDRKFSESWFRRKANNQSGQALGKLGRASADRHIQCFLSYNWGTLGSATFSGLLHTIPVLIQGPHLIWILIPESGGESGKFTYFMVKVASPVISRHT